MSAPLLHESADNQPPDVLIRLREHAKALESWDMHKQPLFAEAADEIERLRIALARIKFCIDREDI